MEPLTRTTPGFSEPSIEIPERTRRRIAAAVRTRLPPDLMERRRQTGLRYRRAAREAEAAAAAATGSGAERRLIERVTLGWTLAEQARIEELGYPRYLAEQLDYESIDDSALEDALRSALPTLAMSPFEIFQAYENDPGRAIFELIIATLLRAVYSPRQLFERMALLWSDHFNIHLFAGLGYLLKPTDDREVVRAHALGSFPELLAASAHSPAMLSYLTNDSNVRSHPNENYARELMELHTLGVDNGYTERDVKEVARCFTGWTFHGRFGGRELGRFHFSELDHDRGKKRVLGRTIAGKGGQEDGEEVIAILAGHPNTAAFVAEKLLRWFWGYRPKRKLVDRVADVYLATGGDLRAMLEVVLAKRRMKTAKPKLKRPLHLLASTLRALFAELDNVSYPLEQLLVAGHLPFNWPAPNGYPDSEGYWSGFVLPRWNFASTFLIPGAGSGVRVDPALVRKRWPVKRIVRTLDQTLLGGGMSPATETALTEFLTAREIDDKQLADAIGLVVASPEFQEY